MFGETDAQVTYQVKVTRKAFMKDGKTCLFDAVVNGVTIYGMRCVEYVNAQGETGHLIGFPSKKSDPEKKDEKGNVIYYNHAFFKISKEVKEDILKQLQAK